MSLATYWQRGETIDYVNETDETIAANTIITLGSKVGVAGTAIDPGETGSLHITGVYYMPKADGEAINAGVDVYLSDDAVTVTASNSNVKAGFSVAAADADSDEVLVKINA